MKTEDEVYGMRERADIAAFEEVVDAAMGEYYAAVRDTLAWVLEDNHSPPIEDDD